MAKQWFQASKEGLRKLALGQINSRGAGIILQEVVANSLDAEADEVIIFAEVYDDTNVRICVTDNGTGFHDLTHAFEVFAESARKDELEKRGRFNLGEKIVLALCDRAKICSTSGTIYFDSNGRRKTKTASGGGTLCEFVIPAENADTAAEWLADIVGYAQRILMPEGTKLVVNGEALEGRQPEAYRNHLLATVKGESLSRTQRSCRVEFFESAEGQGAWLYEMGFPVVELPGPYDVNVCQKVPLNMDRNNVPPAYRRDIICLALDTMIHELDEGDVNEAWVTEAISYPDLISEETMDRVMELKFDGQRLVAAGPNTESNNAAVADGNTTLITPGVLPQATRASLRNRGVLPTSTTLHPPAEMPNEADVQIEDLGPVQEVVARLSKFIGRVACEIDDLDVRFFTNPDSNCVARYSKSKTRVEYCWNECGPDTEYFADHRMIDLIIHELAHEFEGNHLTTKYHDALSMIGAKLAVHAATHPDLGELIDEYNEAVANWGSVPA